MCAHYIYACAIYRKVLEIEREAIGTLAARQHESDSGQAMEARPRCPRSRKQISSVQKRNTQ